MDPRVVSTLKWSAFAVIAFIAFTIGSKHYKKHARKETLAAEMRTLVSDASFYHPLTAKDARSVLLRGIAMVDEAKSLGLEPKAYFDKVFEREQDLLSTEEDEDDHPMREQLARAALTRGYQHALQLDLLADEQGRAAMAAGELPDVSPEPVFAYIIDPALSSGLEKVVPNLDLRPAGTASGKATDLDIAAARQLAGELLSARIIDRQAEKRIIDQLAPAENE